MTNKKVEKVSVTFGCDPEFFFSRDGRVIGAEKVVKKETSDVKIDGVQVELNPTPKTCRELHAFNIVKCLKNVKSMLVGGVRADFSQTIEIEREELDSLDDKNKVFGCDATFGLDGKKQTITVDPLEYRNRSAGGHIHIGLNEDKRNKLLKDKKELKKL